MNKRNLKTRTQKSWILLVGLVTISLLLSACGNAQTPKVYHVGLFTSTSFAAINDGFKAKMTELGYIENKNIVYSVIDTGSDLAELQVQVKKMVTDKVDLIFTSGSPQAVAAKAATAALARHGRTG